MQTVSKTVKSIDDLRVWDFDGSSTNQAPGENSDVYLRPASMCVTASKCLTLFFSHLTLVRPFSFKDPFRGGDNILVLASTYNSDG